MTLRALTLWQPWAYAVAHLGKNIENRGWKPPDWIVGKTLAIHAGATVERGAAEQIGAAFGVEIPKTLPRGAIVATARVVGYMFELSTGETLLGTRERVNVDPRWYSGPYGWLLADVVPIRPVACKGRQGLWTVPVPVSVEVRNAVARARARAREGATL